MKKSLLLTFAILFSITMMAQNRAIFISESFDNSTMPVGWRIMEKRDIQLVGITIQLCRRYC